MGRKPGKHSTLYSAWRNQDDKLLILDGTIEEVSRILGIAPETIRRMAVHTEKTKNEGGRYTIRKMKIRDIKREEES